MVELESEISEGEKPAEEGHGAVEVMVGDGVETARAFKESEIVSHEAEGKKNGAETAGEFAARVEIAGIRGKAQDVGERGQR
jgi:hypothetical protein